MKLLMALLALSLSACTYSNLDEVKAAAHGEWSKQGFEVVAYEGFTWGFGAFEYGGAHVWYRLRKIPDNDITYSGYIQKWGNEMHIYGPHAVDAIRPRPLTAKR